MGLVVLDCSGSWVKVAGCCEHGNELLCSMKCGGLYNWLSTYRYQLLRGDFLWAVVAAQVAPAGYSQS